MSVRLTVTDNLGRSASITKAVTVGASADPKAEFEFSPTAPQAGQTIYFTAAKSTAAPGRRIVSYDWDFGSGRTDSGMTVSKRYDTPGTYKVTLTVTDDSGRKGVTSKDVAVSAAGAVTADFTFSPTAPVAGQTVFFNAGSSTTPAGTTITSYAWDFGDGSTGTGVTPSHAFGAAGTYVVRLTITNSAGQTATTTKNVTVGVAPTADFSFSPTDPTVGQTVFFNAASSTTPAGTTITSYAWDFGDGSTGSGATASHAFGSARTFVVRLTITNDAGQTSTTTKQVTVKP
jgi:PKD repeat protein